MIQGGDDIIMIEIKQTINVTCLNHPPKALEKLSSTKPGPVAIELGDHCSIGCRMAFTDWLMLQLPNACRSRLSNFTFTFM